MLNSSKNNAFMTLTANGASIFDLALLLCSLDKDVMYEDCPCPIWMKLAVSATYNRYTTVLKNAYPAAKIYLIPPSPWVVPEPSKTCASIRLFHGKCVCILKEEART